MKFVLSIPSCSCESILFVGRVPLSYFDFEDEIFLRWLRCNDSHFFDVDFNKFIPFRPNNSC